MSTDKGGKSKRDPLAEAVKRAEQAVLKRTKLNKPKPETSGIGFEITPPKPKKNEPEKLELEKPHESTQQLATQTAPPAAKAPQPATQPEPQLAPPKPAGKPSANLDFGMVDLAAGQDTKTPTIERAAVSDPVIPSMEPDSSSVPLQGLNDPPEQAGPETGVPAQQPAQKKEIRPGLSGSSKYFKGEVTQPRTKKRKLKVSAEKGRPISKRSYAKEIKIALIVIVSLAIIGGGVYGFLKWRAGVAAEEQAEKDLLNSQSLDSLRDAAVKNEGIE
ncbi:MAG: hypothetical protein JRJ19_07965 [Deltaproteobacteria bacterium]|nr:hypothetical protein [Deltaproteobacteria bacterium]MBW1871985.1 hypothetical protein [Deltaproteobacteria bacterium]